jgi:hypothetical protein
LDFARHVYRNSLYGAKQVYWLDDFRQLVRQWTGIPLSIIGETADMANMESETSMMGFMDWIKGVTRGIGKVVGSIFGSKPGDLIRRGA